MKGCSHLPHPAPVSNTELETRKTVLELSRKGLESQKWVEEVWIVWQHDCNDPKMTGIERFSTDSNCIYQIFHIICKHRQ